MDNNNRPWRKMPATMCANCGKYGHVYKNCNHPVTSYGVICYKMVSDGRSLQPNFLLVQRRDSLAYVEFIRGKYVLESRSYITKLLRHMTTEEHSRLLAHNFESLWRMLWQIESLTSFRAEYENSKVKFEHLSRGYHVIDKEGVMNAVNLSLLLSHIRADDNYIETEWGFPKGRRNIGETDHECAIREFFEETSMPSNAQLTLLGGRTLEEVFCGSNNTRYRHVYYVVRLESELNEELQVINSREVNKVDWFSLEEARAKFRPYNVERKALLDEFIKIPGIYQGLVTTHTQS